MSGGKTLVDRREVLLGGVGAAGLLLTASVAGAAATAAGEPGGMNAGKLGVGRGQSFDGGWRFHRGALDGAEASGMDDSAWRAVDLPHDWSIEDLPVAGAPAGARIVGPFSSAAEGGTATGFSVGGEGWYRRRFALQAPTGGRVEILFDGIYCGSDVWLNGQHLGAHHEGYTPRAYDLTSHLAASGDNVLAVRVRNLGKNSRWYSGSGIYRHVWLDVLPEQARIARWGVSVATQRVTDAGAELDIRTRLEGAGAGLTVNWQIKDAKGGKVAAATAAASAELQQDLRVAAPRLWSPDSPTLYTLETVLLRGATVLDRSVVPFGMRVVSFDTEHGMRINGVTTKLRGGCIHHDNGLLGAASFDVAEDRKVLLLKARGYNAVRPSHNVFSPAFLAACDRHGMLVIEETFDAWRKPKLPQDYSQHFDADWRADLAALVSSTRHHPCIIAWSIGNEIPERNSPEGVETQWQLVNEVHRLDPTRPCTAAINGFAGKHLIAGESAARRGAAGELDQASSVFLDIVGYNYKLADYEADHQLFPKRVFFGTESFPKEAAAIWALTERSPWLIGDFVWTSVDYLGEAGIGGSAVVTGKTASPLATMSGWPWINASCGDVDLIGQQKAQSYARDVIWGLSPLEVLVRRPMPEGKTDVARQWGWNDELKSWTWPGHEGKALTVSVYTAGDRVDLMLNGKPAASKPVTAADLKQVQLTVDYAPGVLEAVAYRNGVVLARQQLQTLGAAAAVRAIPERPRAGTARGDISYVGVAIVDAHGRTLPDASQQVELTIAGPAELIAFGSASPFAVGSFKSSQVQTWQGRALAILRATGRSGAVTITARSEGLKSGSARMRLA
jgi:beta-galactosidase